MENSILLVVVLPVYNEQESVLFVLKEWSRYFEKMNINPHWIIIDDGSNDETPKILENFHLKNPSRSTIIQHSNRGHGPSCLSGYERAIQLNAEWILQIDSDGQCDPEFFTKFWNSKEVNPLQFGQRTTRDDGWSRILVSRVLSVGFLIIFGRWLKDSNVPYRLMKADHLDQALWTVPGDFFLANALLCLILDKKYSIHWIPIHFRQRHSGQSHLRFFKLVQVGFAVIIKLLDFRFRKFKL